MSQLLELLEQHRELDIATRAAFERERGEAIAIVLESIKTYHLLPEELFDLPKLARQSAQKKSSRQPRKDSTLSPKYRDPETGATWGGRGRPPRWMQGREWHLFLIEP